MRDVLECRYSRLLGCYPAPQRAQYAEELLATLMDSSRPGQRWPDVRQSAALVLAGLRARCRADRYRPAREVWAQGLQIMVIGVLVYLAVHDLYAGVLQHTKTDLASGLLAAAAVVPVLRGRFRPALLLVTVALTGQSLFGIFTIVRLAEPDNAAQFMRMAPCVRYLIVSLLLVGLMTWIRPEQGRRSPWWLLPMLGLAAAIPGDFAGMYYDAFITPFEISEWWVIVVGVSVLCAVWGIVDARAAVAGTWWLAAITLLQLLPQPYWWFPEAYPLSRILTENLYGPEWTLIITAAALAAFVPAARRVVRQRAAA